MLIGIAMMTHIAWSQSEFTFLIDGGYTSLTYAVSDARRLPAVGYGAHIGYACYFVPWMGIGTGVDFHRMGAGVRYSGEQVWQGVTDTDQETYDHHLQITNWQERYSTYYLEFPLALHFRAPLRHIQLLFAVGAKYSLGIAGRAAAGGQLIHTGYYPKWHLWLDVPAYGFYETSDFRPSRSFRPTSMFAAFARADVAIPVSKVCSIVVGVNAQYGFGSVFATDEAQPLGFRNDGEQGAYFHPFMTDYVCLPQTSIISGSAHPFSINLEIGLHVLIGHKRHDKYPCHCVRD